MWRTRVVHTTGYVYQSPVTASYNEARLTLGRVRGRTSSSTESKPSRPPAPTAISIIGVLP